MSIKLVASDLDGTIINENSFIPEANFKAIEMINEKNINFAICTGKSYSVSKNLCNKFNASYGIFSNGSQIYNLHTGEQIYNSSLSFDDIKSCFLIAKRHKLHVHAYSDFQLITEKLEYLDLRNFKLQRGSGYEFIVTPNVLDYIEKNDLPICQFVISGKENLTAVKNEILEICRVSISKISKFKEYKDRILDKEYEYLSIIPYNTTKSTAIRFLSNYLSINKNDIMAIGDNLNDIDMLRDSGIGVAVANAYSELKDVANYTTIKNVSEGGFAEAVYKFIEQKRPD